MRHITKYRAPNATINIARFCKLIEIFNYLNFPFLQTLGDLPAFLRSQYPLPTSYCSTFGRKSQIPQVIKRWGSRPYHSTICNFLWRQHLCSYVTSGSCTYICQIPFIKKNTDGSACSLIEQDHKAIIGR